MKKRIFIGGISGIGKTTLIKDFCSKHRSVIGISSSSFLTSHKSSAFYRWFDGLDLNERNAIRRNASLKIEREMMANNDTFIVDGHFTAFNRFTKEPETCFNEIDASIYNQIVLLDATPELVLFLRKNDKRKKSYSGRSFGEIAEQLNMERNVALLIAARCNIPLKIIDVISHSARCKQLETLVK